MKIKAVLFFFVMTTSLLFAGDNLLEQFTAKSDGKVITLEWKSTDESYISKFEIERSTSDMIFTRITTIDAKGYVSSYRYIDEEAFMKSGDNEKVQANNIYFFRIKVLKKDNNYIYSNTVPVTHNVSGFRRTWGMIKEMFK